MIVTAIVFLALVLITPINKESNIITGHTIIDKPEDVQVALQEILREEMFQDIGSNAKICIGVNDETDQTHFYKIRKQGDIFNVQQAQHYCDGMSIEHMVFRFENYQVLADLKDSHKFNPLVDDRTGEVFQTWDSKYSKSGLLLCEKEFKTEYCGFIKKQMSTSEQKIAGVYTCCSSVDVEMPNNENIIFTYLKKFWWIFGLILVSVILGISAMSLLTTKEENDDDQEENNNLKQIENYVISTRKKEFTDDMIKKQLVEAGWEKKDIKKAFGIIRKKHLTNLGDRFEKVSFNNK